MKVKKKGLSREPQNITEETWYYEEKRGLNVIHEIRQLGVYLRTDTILLPWRKVLNSVKRFRKSSDSSK